MTFTINKQITNTRDTTCVHIVFTHDYLLCYICYNQDGHSTTKNENKIWKSNKLHALIGSKWTLEIISADFPSCRDLM